LCHCTTGRKENGAPLTASAIFRSEDETVQGDTANWKDSTDDRHFCLACGSSVFSVSDGTGEIEIRPGTFDVTPTGCVANLKARRGKESEAEDPVRYVEVTRNEDTLRLHVATVDIVNLPFLIIAIPS
jgi:hypothetical protein